MFLATLEGDAQPAAVEGLLLLPPDRLPMLEQTPTVAEVEAAGGEVRAHEVVAPETRLWLHPNEDVSLAARLLPEPA